MSEVVTEPIQVAQREVVAPVNTLDSVVEKMAAEFNQPISNPPPAAQTVTTEPPATEKTAEQVAAEAQPKVEEAKADPAKTGDEKPKTDEIAPTSTDELELTLQDIDKSAAIANQETEPKWSSVIEEKGWIVPDGFTEEKGFEVYEQLKDAEWNKKVEEARQLSLEQHLSKLDPKAATAVKLLQMGIDKDAVFAPTQKIQEYLKFDDAAIVREDLKYKNYTPEMIDVKMEELASNPSLLKTQADIVRLELKQLEQQTLQQQDNLVKQFEQRQQEAALHQKQQENVQFKETLGKIEKFMDTPLKPEIKDAIAKKYANGEYDSVLNSPQAKAKLILFEAFGDKILSAVKNRSFEQGREKIAKNLTNVPELQKQAGTVVRPNNQTEGSNQFDDVINKMAAQLK